jgi:hypothetical protein
MARCETCGNDYDKAFQVSMNGTTHTFDSFECAGADLRQLRHSYPRSRARKGRYVLLLRSLRRGQRRDRPARPNWSRRRDRNGFSRVSERLGPVTSAEGGERSAHC